MIHKLILLNHLKLFFFFLLLFIFIFIFFIFKDFFYIFNITNFINILIRIISLCFIIFFWCFRFSRFLTRSHTKPLGQLCFLLFVPFSHSLFPFLLQELTGKNLPSPVEKPFFVFISSIIGSPFKFRCCLDHRRMFPCQCLCIKSHADSLQTKSLSLPLRELLKVIMLALLPFFQIIFFCFETNNVIPQVCCL